MGGPMWLYMDHLGQKMIDAFIFMQSNLSALAWV